jgi:hypothetical protein
MIKNSAIHPFLFAVYPIIYLYAHNIRDVSVKEIVLPSLFVLVFTLVLWLIINIVLRNSLRSAFLTTLVVCSFFIYGHFFEFLEQKDIFIPAYRHKQLIPLVFLIVGYSYYFLRRVIDFKIMTQILNIIGIILILINIPKVIVNEIKVPTLIDANHKLSLKDIEISSSKKNKAFYDIYYIIFDEYARLDTMKTVYNYKDLYFKKFLSEKGFFIANNSTLPYSSSHKSIYSSLNMNYVSKDILDKNLFNGILDNKVARYLKSKGYEYIYISDQPLYDGTYCNPYADLDLKKLQSGEKSEIEGIGPFRLVLIKTTMLRGFYSKMIRDGLRHRNAELQKIRILKKVVALDGPKFVVSHHLISHAPFVFDSNGGMVDKKDHYNWKDKNFYLDAYIFSNKMITELISTIHQNSPKPPIIIIQSDHGPRGGMGKNTNPKKIYLGTEWQKVFNAYYLPDGGNRKLYDSISPVNTFRIVFNYYFDDTYTLLEDQTP